MSSKKKTEVRRASYWAEFPAEERRKRAEGNDAQEVRRVVSERRNSKWKSRFRQVLGRNRPDSVSFEMLAGWELRQALDGSVYYYEIDSGTVSWDKPDELKSAHEKEEDAAEWVWVPHAKNVWQPARVKSREKSGEVSVRLLDRTTVRVPHIRIMRGKITGGVSQQVPLWPLKRSSLDRVEADLVALPTLDEGMIMHNLRLRYEGSDIYTWVGSSRSVLVSVNPFQELALYTDDQKDLQRMGAKGEGAGANLAPHVFAIANDSLDALVLENRSQSILISGESGAGKTHATKACLDFLAHVAASGNEEGGGRGGRGGGGGGGGGGFTMTTSSGGGGGGGGKEQKVEQKVLVANPLLEAFGNAKTVRNNNSSRFGKWIAVYIDRRAKHIAGAQITSFLLESSRVVLQSRGERNYHIFYQLLSHSDMRERYMLEAGANHFHYLNQSGSVDIDGVDDEEAFGDVLGAMEQLGIDDEEQEWLMRTTCAVLHLGNVQFAEVKLPNGGKGCELMGSPSGGGQAAGEASADKDEEDGGAGAGPAHGGRGGGGGGGDAWLALEHAAELLEIDRAELERVLTRRSITVRGEKSVIPLKVKQAVNARDSLAKGLYARVFDWLVARVNQSFGEASGKFVGILDIFGFEIFEHNSFEQLCINYANERLQQLFNQHTFGDEEELYEVEKIHFKHIDFQDNQPVLDLIDKKPNGILNLLDDECIVPGGSDSRFMGRIEGVHQKTKAFKSLGSSSSNNKSVKRLDGEALDFTIKHFAGTVTYDAMGFMAKNIDTLFQDLYDIAAKSSDELTQELFPVLEEDARLKVESQSAKFRSQLSQLMVILRKTETRYIRCIKPNAEQAANHFDGRKCLEQLRASGIFESVEIRKTGFPFRLYHSDFVAKYRCINLGYMYHAHSDKASEVKAFCREIIDASPQKFAGVQIGETRVLYRVEDHKMLELLRNLALATVVPKIQQVWRMALGRRFRKNLRKAEDALVAAMRLREAKDKSMGKVAPDIGKLEKAIENVPDVLGRIGAIYRVLPPSLEQAKALHGALERWEAVEDDLEDFEDCRSKDDDDFDEGKAAALLATADKLRKEGVPMTAHQKELYDHTKELLVGEEAEYVEEELESKASEALLTLSRDQVLSVSREANEWTREPSQVVQQVKAVASKYTSVDSQVSRAVTMVDHELLVKVVRQAEELAYSTPEVERARELLLLDERDFVEEEVKCARANRDRKRIIHRELRLREFSLAECFDQYEDFFANDRVRGNANSAGVCSTLFSRRNRRKRDQPKLSEESLETVFHQHSIAVTADASRSFSVMGGTLAGDDNGGTAGAGFLSSGAIEEQEREMGLEQTATRSLVNTTRRGQPINHSPFLEQSVLFTRDKDDIKRAQAAFKAIRTYMGDVKKQASPEHRNLAGSDLIKIGLYNEKLRDEIFSQIVKQLTDNRDKESVKAGVDLLCLCASAFPPSNEPFENYLSVWARLHLPGEFYQTLMSTFHDHRFVKNKHEHEDRIFELVNIDRKRVLKAERRESVIEPLALPDVEVEHLRAKHSLAALRRRFKAFTNKGSRWSVTGIWESDLWLANPDFAPKRFLITSRTFHVSSLTGFGHVPPPGAAGNDASAGSAKSRMSRFASNISSTVKNTAAAAKAGAPRRPMQKPVR